MAVDCINGFFANLLKMLNLNNETESRHQLTTFGFFCELSITLSVYIFCF